MPCPDPRHCPKLIQGRCSFLLGTSETHAEIRADCNRRGRIPEAIVVEKEELGNDLGILAPATVCRNTRKPNDCGRRPDTRGHCAFCMRTRTL
jgi:hypothetical protein